MRLASGESKNHEVATPNRALQRMVSSDSKSSLKEAVKVNSKRTRTGNVKFEVQGAPIEMNTPSLSPDGRRPNEEPPEMDQSPDPLAESRLTDNSKKRRIITDIQSHTESKRNVLQNVQSLDTLGNIPSEPNLNHYMSQGNIVVAPEQLKEEQRLANLSPSKRGAAALEGSPMFTPLEVKFKNMKHIDSSPQRKPGMMMAESSPRKY